MKGSLLILVCSLVLVSTDCLAQNLITLELHNTRGRGWGHNEAVVLNPTHGLMFTARKGIGGPDAAVMAGYRFNMGKFFALHAFLGTNIDDTFNFVHVRPEIWYSLNIKFFQLFAVTSLGIPTHDTRQFELYMQLTPTFWIKHLALGLRTDAVYFFESANWLFWMVGPRVGYRIVKKEDQALTPVFGLWGGWEKQLNTRFVQLDMSFFF